MERGRGGKQTKRDGFFPAKGNWLDVQEKVRMTREKADLAKVHVIPFSFSLAEVVKPHTQLLTCPDSHQGNRRQ